MKDEHLVLLLQLIENKGSVDSLLKLDLQYSQIADMIAFLLEDKLITLDEEGMRITSDGSSKFAELNEKLGRKKIESWISPQLEYKMEKKDKFDIYLPKDTNFR